MTQAPQTHLETDGLLCQYCDKPRNWRGWRRTFPTSLCDEHKRMHGLDFDSVTPVRAAHGDKP